MVLAYMFMCCLRCVVLLISLHGHETHPNWRLCDSLLQTQNMGIRMGGSKNPAMYKGTIDAFMRIAREEGVAGLYRLVG